MTLVNDTESRGIIMQMRLVGPTFNPCVEGLISPGTITVTAAMPRVFSSVIGQVTTSMMSLQNLKAAPRGAALVVFVA